MRSEVILPKWGMTMQDGTVVEWLISEGQRVQEGDPIAVIETEKVETHVIIDSPEPPERIQALLEEAESSCMAHHALRNPIPWSTRLVYNGVEIDARDSAE